MSYPEIKALPMNTFLDGLSRLDMNIPYSDRPGCTLDILLPWANQHQHVLGEVKYPLVVFVQGSSWTTPNRGTELPQLSELSRNGYVVATVGHRSCLDGYQAPAFLVDVKTTIRFLRVHAKDYSIDPEYVAIWGTSSGGNTALLVGLTAGDKRFFTMNVLANPMRCSVSSIALDPQTLKRWLMRIILNSMMIRLPYSQNCVVSH